MQAKNVYVFSSDNYLIEHWEKINNNDWNVIALKSVQKISSLEPNQLVIIDVAALNTESTEFWQQVCAQQDCIIASLKANDPEGQHALVLGAKAYVHGYSTIALWHQILTHVQNGHIWIGQSLLSRLLSKVSENLPEMTNDWSSELTPREIEIAQRVALGHGNQLIADDLNISERTVRAHLTAIFEKLDVNDRLMLSLVVHGVHPEKNKEMLTI